MQWGLWDLRGLLGKQGVPVRARKHKDPAKAQPKRQSLQTSLPTRLAHWAHHDPGVVHELRDGHSLSGLCFQQVPDEHFHC